jgi:small subunit ribosomal protein S16
MLAIRLARFGSKKKPTYRLVVIEKDNPRDGRAVEVVGHYNPVAQPTELNIKRDRVDYWIARGAQPTDTVKRLLKAQPAEAVTA